MTLRRMLAHKPPTVTQLPLSKVLVVHDYQLWVTGLTGRHRVAPALRAVAIRNFLPRKPPVPKKNS